MPFPSTLSSFTDPSPSDRLSTTPHSSIETAQNTGLREIQAFIGTESSAVGTLMYDIRAAASNGGGHVQTAVKGGTGQTTFTKGDILVATAASVLSKLAVGNDADILTADSSVAAGVKWNPGVNSAAIQNQSFSFATETGTGSVYSISPVPCVLSYSSGQEFSFIAGNANTVAVPAINVSSLAARSIKNPDGSNLFVGQIAASMITVLRYNGNSSVFQLTSQKAQGIASLNDGVTTRAGDAASGSQTIAHGLGLVPRYVRITAFKNFSAGNNVALAQSIGVYNGTTTATVQVNIGVQGTAPGTATTDSTNIIAILDSSASNQQVATVAVDATNITLTWTKTGSPGAATINIMWEAQA